MAHTCCFPTLNTQSPGTDFSGTSKFYRIVLDFNKFRRNLLGTTKYSPCARIYVGSLKMRVRIFNGAEDRIRTYVGILPTVLQTVPFGHFGTSAWGYYVTFILSTFLLFYFNTQGLSTNLSGPSKMSTFCWHIKVRLRTLMEPGVRFELTTYPLQGDCSTNWAIQACLIYLQMRTRYLSYISDMNALRF